MCACVCVCWGQVTWCVSLSSRVVATVLPEGHDWRTPVTLYVYIRPGAEQSVAAAELERCLRRWRLVARDSIRARSVQRHGCNGATGPTPWARYWGVRMERGVGWWWWWWSVISWWGPWPWLSTCRYRCRRRNTRRRPRPGVAAAVLAACKVQDARSDTRRDARYPFKLLSSMSGAQADFAPLAARAMYPRVGPRYAWSSCRNQDNLAGGVIVLFV